MKQIAGVDGAFEQQTIMNKFLMQCLVAFQFNVLMLHTQKPW